MTTTPIVDFGRTLLETGDLDPIYIALRGLQFEDEQLCRWLVAYWCFYHAGFACYACDAEDTANYFERLVIAAANVAPTPLGGRWPRGAERRHFRGLQGIQAVGELAAKFNSASEIIDMITERKLKYGSPAQDQPIPAERIMANARKLRGFGPWISFKVADMVERLGLELVSFDKAAVFMFKDPVEGARRLFDQENVQMGEEGLKGIPIQIKIDWSLSYLEHRLGHYKAPPAFDRPIGLQEMETILCKWKSHQNGHYPALKDINEIRHGLTDWAKVSNTAQRFLNVMPNGEKVQ